MEIETLRERPFREAKVTDGFFTFHLSPTDLLKLRQLVHDHWLSVLGEQAAEHLTTFAESGMKKYHLHSHLCAHAEIWSKLNRILPPKNIIEIRKLAFMQHLSEAFGSFEISDEENVGFEEIYWRLVRPKQTQDVGPMHADCWFWDLGHGSMPPNKTRVKIWIPLFCEPGSSGLEVVPGSHKSDWKYHGEMRNGFVKPVFDEDISRLNVSLLPTEPGEAVVFSDRLLHKGAVNRGIYTRVSCEFTLFVDPAKVLPNLRDIAQHLPNQGSN